MFVTILDERVGLELGVILGCSGNSAVGTRVGATVGDELGNTLGDSVGNTLRLAF